MKLRAGVPPPANPGRRRGAPLQDEVYRQMFRLEEGRRGAESSLALALLRAWLAVDCGPETDPEREWLKKISPICVEMIEQALRKSVAAPPDR